MMEDMAQSQENSQKIDTRLVKVQQKVAKTEDTQSTTLILAKFKEIKQTNSLYATTAQNVAETLNRHATDAKK